jgi:hypothetical protein
MAVDKDWRQKILVTSLLLPLSPLSVLQLKEKRRRMFQLADFGVQKCQFRTIWSSVFGGPLRVCKKRFQNSGTVVS